MLIIFDLDDTLIDTSGSIIPFKMKECLKLMVKNGLELADFDAAYKRLLIINTSCLSSKAALEKFTLEVGKGITFVKSILEELEAPLPKNHLIKMTPGAKVILETLRNDHTLALVTAGSLRFQMEKLEKAGIDRSIFSNIAVVESSTKKLYYQRLIQEFSVLPQDVIVCGDRIEGDLKPAHELGMQTVHMRFGRGLVKETDDWVQHQIHTLSELKRIVQK